MPVWRWAISRPVATLMGVGVAVWAGLFALRTLPLGLLPELTPPVVTVVTSYSGASPEAVAELVTEPVEQALSTVNGLRELVSESTENTSIVVARFQWGSDMEAARDDINRRLDSVPLPEGAGRPLLFRFDPDQLPVLEISVSGTSGRDALARVIRERVVPRLEQVPGVATVALRGAPDRRVEVVLDPAALRRHGLTPTQVRAAIAAASRGAAVGTVRDATGGRLWPLRVEGGFTGLEELRRVVVGLSEPVWVPPAAAAVQAGARSGSETRAGPNLPDVPGGTGIPPTAGTRGTAGARGSSGVPVAAGAVPVRLADVADIVVESKTSGIERINGREGVSLLVYQQAGANTVSVVRGVRAQLDRLASDLPGTQWTVTHDGGAIVERAVGGVAQSLVVGGLLAVLVLWLFLRDLRAVAVIAAAIPVSVCATLAAMHIAGMTLNVMSLGGLALSAGILIDQAIVVLESIARKREEGLDPRQAADAGTEEVAGAITGSTLTNVIVFLPVVFLGGLTGQLFRELALANVLAQLASLLVSVTLVPALASWWLRVPTRATGAASGARPAAMAGEAERPVPAGALRLAATPRPSPPGSSPVAGTARVRSGRPVQGGTAVPPWLERLLARPGLTLAAGLCLVLAVLPIGRQIGTEFLPDVNEGAVDVSVTLPAGATLDQTGAALRRVEAVVAGMPGVSHFVSRAGQGDLPGEEGAPHRGLVRVQWQGADAPGGETAARLRRMLVGDAELRRLGAQVTVRPRNLWADVGAAAPVVELTVAASDPERLREAVTTVRQVLAAVPGLRDVAADLDHRQPELALRVDAASAVRHGLLPVQVAEQLRTAVSGDVVARGRVDGEWVPVVLRSWPEEARQVTALGRVELSGAGGWTPVDEVAALVPGETPTRVHRRDGLRMATVTARVEGVDFGTALARALQAVAASPLPPGITVRPAGTAVLMEEGFSTLVPAAAGAVLLVYMVMAAQFESLRYPLLIMLTLPLALVGGILGLWLARDALGLTAVMGGIVLAGIAVNNGIVLVDAAVRERAAGASPEEAIRRAWSRRVRPVLMTALTTLLGALPMVLIRGEGNELEAPLSVVLVGGLFSSTALTLVVLPCAWLLLERRRRQGLTGTKP
ncbi:MAG TPA: efflux RND transporter permease subunit [Thermaerobacter sp.]